MQKPIKYVPRVLLCSMFAAVAALGSLPARSLDNSDMAAGSGAGADWRQYNKTLNGQRFSPLKQINTANASTLSEKCRVEISHGGSFQAGPLMIDGTMYVTADNDTVALDAVSCAIRWRHTYRGEEPGFFSVNRGVAFYNGRLFRGTEDARVIALDAATGKEAWVAVVGDGRKGEFISSAPIAWNGIVFVGLAASDFGIKGRIVAFDAATGRQVWRFNTVPTGNEPGAESWKDGRWAEHGGGGSWSSFALDADAQEIFIPVGNPAPDFSPDDRPGANLYTDSVLVLDALTGAVKWYYQLTPHDGHDWDLGAAPVLYVDAKDRHVVAAAGKDGYLHAVDRDSHKLLFKVPTTTVDAVPAAPTKEGVKVCPGTSGGTEWNGPAIDPTNQLVFVGAVDMCQYVNSKTGQQYQTGHLAYGGGWQVLPEKATGWISAFDSDTGKLRWKYHADSVVLGALTPTAGGIVFGGDNAGNLLVFESTTGKVLKKIDTKGSLSGGIITYEIGGRQYVAATSGNVSRTGWSAVGRPNIVVYEAALPVPSSSANGDAASGRDQYLRNCAACHAADGAGVRGYDLMKIKKQMNQAQLVAWIKNPAPPMPKVFPDPLTPEEERVIRDIAAYLTAQ